ncbi:MAG: BatA domain-containing protein [Phycisphaerae bacterium]
MELLAPWSLMGLVLVPAVFLWGLLAPRGRRVVVGSLLLWKRALGDGPAGKPSARVRLADPLLWLDAVLVLLVVVALARPAVRTAAPLDPVATLVIDRTASMGAWAGAERDRRADRARAMMSDVLGALGDAPIRLVLVPDDSNAVLAERVTAEEFQRRFVRTCGFVLASRDALPVALAEASGNPDLPILYVTDVAPREKVPENVYVLAAGGESRNVGLRRVAVRGDWLLVSARAAPDAPGSCDLRVCDAMSRPLATERAFVSPGETVERNLLLPGAAGGKLAVILDGPDDGFPEDNQAQLALEQAGPLRILLVGDAPAAMSRALAACGDTAVVESPAGTAPRAGEVDLVVAYASALPAEWKGPAALVLPPEGAGPVRPTDQEAPAEWRVAVDHPLADALYLEPPRLGPVRRYALDPSARVVLGTPDVPLIVTWEASGVRRLAVLFGFDEPATDWARRAGFPVFWRRALDWLVPRDARGTAYRTFGVSLTGSDEGFQAGPGRDDSKAAVEAIRGSIEARRRATLADLWPYLAAAAVVALLARARVAK